jgi:RNA-directed DNA polymerase
LQKKDYTKCVVRLLRVSNLVVKPRLRGEACMVRYIDDFVLCFQYREDALRVQEALANRLRRFSLTLEPTKTKTC